MSLPKKIKKDIPLTRSKTLFPRREELADMIAEDGTYLPKSILHADLDRGFLDFVRDELKTVVEGNTVPMVDILVTTQNWSQFVETWNFQNIDKNIEPPFITVIRNPEVKYGNNPAIIYNIPNRRLYFYARVPTWDGQRHGMDVYKIPQPVPVDIKFTVAIICNRMRELNKFNQIILTKFSSLQSYQMIKGHYIPIKFDGNTDESVVDLEKRKFYIQKYEFTMMGFLIDEDEFEVQPAVSRVFQIYETDTASTKRSKKRRDNKGSELIFDFSTTETEKTLTIEYTVDLFLTNTINVDEYSVYINDDFYGTNLSEIQVNTNDVIKIIIVKNVTTDSAQIIFQQKLL